MPYGRHNHSYEAHRHQNGVGATQHQPGVTIPMYCLTPPPLPTFCHSPLFWINCIARCYKSSQCPTQGVEKNICPYLRQMDPIRQEQRRLTNDYIGVAIEIQNEMSRIRLNPYHMFPECSQLLMPSTVCQFQIEYHLCKWCWYFGWKFVCLWCQCSESRPLFARNRISNFI